MVEQKVAHTCNVSERTVGFTNLLSVVETFIVRPLVLWIFLKKCDSQTFCALERTNNIHKAFTYKCIFFPRTCNSPFKQVSTIKTLI